MSRRWKIFIAVGLLSLLADQASKIWARSSLPTFTRGDHTYGRSVEVIAGWWDWRLSFNPGSAFSLFHDTSGARVFLTIVGLVAVAAIVWMVHKASDDQRRLAVALGLVIGGALGNLVDRIYFGKVTDFVVWKYQTKEWPTFNVADVTLVAGVLLLFLDIAIQSLRERKAAGEGSKQGGEAAGEAETAATTGARKPRSKKSRG